MDDRIYGKSLHQPLELFVLWIEGETVMQSIIYLKDLGPIKETAITLNRCLVMTGAQASGKSSIAKAVYFFLSIKDDIVKTILDSLKKQGINSSVSESLVLRLREKFDGIFGDSYRMNLKMMIRCQYNDNTFVSLSLSQTNPIQNGYGDLEVEYSDNILDILNGGKYVFSTVNSTDTIDEARLKNELQEELTRITGIDYDVTYIPAGRGIVTTLGDQLSYLLVDSDLKPYSSVDFCTYNFFREILRVRSKFTSGLKGLMDDRKAYLFNADERESLNKFSDKIAEILKGRYYYRPGNEILALSDGSYVHMNYSSSGQQEIVWVLNLLFYYTINKQKMLLILEEPETHLFPDSQKLMVELLAMFYNAGNKVIFTTHSPYVLGETNNLIYAGKLYKNKKQSVQRIVDKDFAIDLVDLQALFVEEGVVSDCMDYELGQIDNLRIDGISKVINEEYDKLLVADSED